MVFKQILREITFSIDELNLINHLAPLKGHEWDGKLPGKKRGSRQSRDEIKKSIRAALGTIQGDHCCFCGLSLYETSGAFIEHIAPKGLHPSFMFTAQNLALACGYCNGFDKKSTYDTIAQVNAVYDNCAFNIVHPYKDDPTLHYEIADYDAGGLIIRFLTEKARQSRDLFHLDSPEQVQARGKQFLHQELGSDAVTEALLKDILKRKHFSK